MTDIDDGWLKVPAVHEPIVRTKPSPAERDRE